MSIRPDYAPYNESAEQVWEEESYLIGDTVLGFFALGESTHHRLSLY